jgi:hypothetical protein
MVMEDVTELYVLWILSLLSFDFLALLPTAFWFKLPRMWAVPGRCIVPYLSFGDFCSLKGIDNAFYCEYRSI